MLWSYVYCRVCGMSFTLDQDRVEHERCHVDAEREREHLGTSESAEESADRK